MTAKRLRVRLHKLWRPSFPKDMTEQQACELALAHWKRMARDPVGAKKRGERPVVRSCALCWYADRGARGCVRCPLHQYEIKASILASRSLCCQMYSVAFDAFRGRSELMPSYFRKAAKPIIKRLEELLVWVKGEKK